MCKMIVFQIITLHCRRLETSYVFTYIFQHSRECGRDRVTKSAGEDIIRHNSGYDTCDTHPPSVCAKNARGEKRRLDVDYRYIVHFARKKHILERSSWTVLCENDSPCLTRISRLVLLQRNYNTVGNSL